MGLSYNRPHAQVSTTNHGFKRHTDHFPVVANSNNPPNPASATIDPNKYYAILLTNGSVYFGHIESLGSAFPVLHDVYYVQSAQNPDTKAVSNILVKRGKEWHGPDGMIVAEEIGRLYRAGWSGFQSGAVDCGIEALAEHRLRLGACRVLLRSDVHLIPVIRKLFTAVETHNVGSYPGRAQYRRTGVTPTRGHGESGALVRTTK